MVIINISYLLSYIKEPSFVVEHKKKKNRTHKASPGCSRTTRISLNYSILLYTIIYTRNFSLKHTINHGRNCDGGTELVVVLTCSQFRKWDGRVQV